ncbi:universal stress protein [Herbiconiux sp. L3-i23]|uniref:universal stress protein n=1 Tax=Herbiconiux sp. L3-i23 TaxID=2905871 RepID=UPI00206F0808|nr:universal stress protein [Herbiconiux sp. L3-i23]BDI21435.1 hypothetical protein L3i23_02110 [Herbiconiux sp. L3-i23]
MADESRGTSIVVGVVPTQPDEVTRTAARFATLMQARLHFVYVDTDRYSVAGIFSPADPIIEPTMSMKLDAADDVPREFGAELAERIVALLPPGVQWETHRMAGDPAAALSALADERDAAMIVVGTRESTVRASVREFFNGSVAVHLAHRQHRPVLVVPLAPVGSDQDLPWG